MLNGDTLLILTSLVLRVVFFLYGIHQDANFKVRYTDIDYFVFHDAAGYVFEWCKKGGNGSPYQRDTYRYTPLLSWLLVPNHYFNWFHLGKLIFIAFDLFTGLIIHKLVRQSIHDKKASSISSRSLLLSSIWLLNPMVITISTRGNAESVLCFLVMLALYFLQKGKFVLSGVIYGLSIHFKIYPIIYCLPMSIYVYHTYKNQGRFGKLFLFGVSTLLTVVGSSALMYKIYGSEFLEHAYWYHLYRTDHRHNFSLWNMLLYFDSATPSSTSLLSKFAFVPQMTVTIAIATMQWSLPTFENLLNVLFIQTFAFVTYNKVCTSQYFVWYLIFLPFYIANTTLSWQKGVCMVTLWVTTQAFWLFQGYLLEFEGKNVFYPGMLLASASFFLGNVWLLGQFIGDIKYRESRAIKLIHKKKST